MKWFFKIFLSVLVVILGLGFGGVITLTPERYVATDHSSIYALQQLADFGANPKFFPQYRYQGIAKLLATEYEEDNEPASGKKQTVKINPAILFANAWSYINTLPVIKLSLPSDKLPLILTLNKIYLAIQVFRL